MSYRAEPLNQPAEIPPELDRWNWGAFLLNWIWGLGNSVFIALLMFVPFVNIVMMFVLGARGSRWAWKSRPWHNAEHFRRTQRNWAIAGVIVWLLALALAGSVVAAVPMILKNTGAYEQSLERVRADPRIREALGDGINGGFWVTGSVNASGGSGSANLAIPLSGSKGTGTAYAQASRSGGVWTTTLLYVVIEGRADPIVLINTRDLALPNTGMDV